MDKPYVQGTCDGTGAAINVCLGFIPSRVVVTNLDSAVLAEITWSNLFKHVAAIDEGILRTTITDSDLIKEAANGIAEYAGGDTVIYSTAGGHWHKADNSTNAEEIYVDGAYELLHASNPAFRAFGDAVVGKPRYDAANALTGGALPLDGTKLVTTEGFTIKAAGGTNTVLNVDGEQLGWIAFR